MITAVDCDGGVFMPLIIIPISVPVTSRTVGPGSFISHMETITYFQT